MTKKTASVAGLTFLAAPAVVLLAAGPALAAASSGDVQVTNTETVQAYLDATGDVDVARVYEQVAMQGKGTVNLVNPVETHGLRNLDGFSGFQVKNGDMVGTYAVDGEQRLRSVSDFTKKLPLDVHVTYTLDGKPVAPGDVVGQSGTLAVQYTVRNVTGRQQSVSFDDGTGKTTTTSADVVLPMVGSLTTVLPAGFTDVSSDEAAIAGDGHGGTQLSFTMALFGPIGAPEATFGYQAKITDGVIPKATLAALPISPLDSPSFKGGAASYKSGAETGAALTAGATQIDANLLKLRDGASQLLAGLIKLKDGANQLHSGLAGQAAPGARALADGARQLKDGTGQLAAGASKAKTGSAQVSGGATQLAGGARRLAGGAAQVDTGAGQLLNGLTQAGTQAPQLLTGLAQVSSGLDLVDGGLAQLYGGIGQLPAQAQPLHDGIAQLKAGIGNASTANTLVAGVDQLRAGLAAATAQGGPLDQLSSGVAQSKGGVDLVNSGLQAALAPGGSIDQAAAAIASIAAVPACAVDPTCLGTVDAVKTGVRQQLSASTSQASGGLTQVSAGLGQVTPGLTQLKGSLAAGVTGLVKIECGLSNTTLTGWCDPARPGLLEGLSALDAGVLTLVDGVVGQVQSAIGTATDLPSAGTLRGGVHGLQGGVDLIGTGGSTLINGLAQLQGGAAQLKGGTSALNHGAGDLASGAGQLDTGAWQLDDGLGELATGAGKVDSGAGQLKSGAGQLSSGLGTAASGSGQLADGLGQATGGAPKLVDGAQQLSDQGTTKLIAAGKSTAADYGQKYALIEAGAQRAKAESMAYGAPAGAAGQTAYSFELAGADGEGSRDLGRGLGAAAIFALAGGVGVLRLRR
jgi:putative membrane protein